MTKKNNSLLIHFYSCCLCISMMAVCLPVSGQSEPQGDLFDRFGLQLEASSMSLKTQLRLDSKSLGQGTNLSFENDLELGSSKSTPSISADWQIGRKHRISARWLKVNRSSSAQALTDIHWGDESVPVNAEVLLKFDIRQLTLDYTYFPWVKDRWAAGFGMGLRVLNIIAELSWQESNTGQGGVEGTDATGPLPYLNFEYRRMVTENWRMITSLGWLYLQVGDLEGGQWLTNMNLEYLLSKRWAFGGSANISNIDIEWTGLKDDTGQKDLTSKVDLDINDVSLYVRVRF
jgi:hypothetical protein